MLLKALAKASCGSVKMQILPKNKDTCLIKIQLRNLLFKRRNFPSNTEEKVNNKDKERVNKKLSIIMKMNGEEKIQLLEIMTISTSELR